MNPDHSCHSTTRLFTRRGVLRNFSCGFGWLAFAGLAQRAGATATAGPLAPKATHFPARAKPLIFLTMRSGPSHVNTFDYKPQLNADSDKPGKRPGTKLLGSK